MATFDEFRELDIRVGEIVDAETHTEARTPAYKLRIDFGDELGVKGSSAQLRENYGRDDLIGRQVVATVNLPPRRVAGFVSEVLVLAAVSERDGTVLLRPDTDTALGGRIA